MPSTTTIACLAASTPWPANSSRRVRRTRTIANSATTHTPLSNINASAARIAKPASNIFDLPMERPVSENWREANSFLPLEGASPTVSLRSPNRVAHRVAAWPIRPVLPGRRVIRYPLSFYCRSGEGVHEANVRVGSCVTSTVMSTTVRNCTRDEGGPFEAGSQVLASSHRKLLSSKAMVVSVAETPGQDSGRQG